MKRVSFSPPRLALTVTALLALPVLAAAAPTARRSPAKPTTPAAKQAPLEYNRDILPILSQNCFRCHGFDSQTRMAGLRLDIPEGAFAKLAAGHAGLVPGKPDESSVIARVENGSMPPANSGLKLTNAQMATLRRWVAEGAKYQPHWAFIPPVRPTLPAVKDSKWSLNPIDRFVLARLEREGLRPSPIADRPALIRRVTQDLTGLPPTKAEIEAFLADRQPGAYERVVDRLLTSPHYGERMALKWLDLARYADTHGFHIDSHRDMWRWRDWVIDAYNKNMPFDEFTVEQLAGDLLPNATRDQKIATGFNRNHPINFEGGAIAEEYQAAYIFDRIDTTATTFMGLTMACARCHDHKYDPLTQKDFYSFYAYFNNIAEQGLDGTKGNAVPFIKAPLPEQETKLAELDSKVTSLQQALQARSTAVTTENKGWEQDVAAQIGDGSSLANGLAAHFGLDERNGATIHEANSKLPEAAIQGQAAWDAGKFGGALKLDGATAVNLGTAFDFERTDKFSYGAWVKPEGDGAMTVLSRMDDASDVRGWDLYLGGNKAFVHLISKWEGNAIRVNTKNAIDFKQWHHLFVTYDGSGKAAGVRIYVDGEAAPLDVTHDKLTDSIKVTTPVYLGRRNPAAPFKGLIDEVRVYNRELSAPEVKQLAGLEALREVMAIPTEKRTPEQQKTLLTYYLENRDEPYKKLNAEYGDMKRQREELDKSIPTTMVMEELPKPRDTYMLIRGEYDKHGDKVTAATPQTLPAMPSGLPNNRLGLARWLVSPTHPLTARVTVNRFWQNYFGNGLVRTVENFGLQGEVPSHPELLDWLATEFIRTGWDIKAMQRLIVTSSTYRQVSRATPALRERDPENRLLARGPRVRLPAEFIRDQALAVSGLLNEKLGGPSVKPYQPSGLWEELAFGGGFTAQTYVQDHGDALYRRSMYIFWKRTCPPPSLQTFDAPEREFCVVRRSNSNTPLQSLVLMNDPTYIEAARKFAERIMQEGGETPASRISFACEAVLGRPAKPTEAKVLGQLYTTQLTKYQADRAGAEKLLTVGESPRNEKLDVAELAAWSNVASVVLNLDEAITKQ